jgi:GNAT superfamily N-acetyltransferase
MDDPNDRIRDLVESYGWPSELANDIISAGISHSELKYWQWESLPPQVVPIQLEWYQRFSVGDLRGRTATLADNDALADLFDRCHEELGEWEVFTERSPNAFAQFYLQRTAQLSLIDDGKRLIACVAWARRNVLVGGRRVSASYGEALRVDPDYRRQGFGDQVRRLPQAIGALPVEFRYDYTRTDNLAIANWKNKYEKYTEGDEWRGASLDIPVTVTEIPVGEFHGSERGIRKTRPEDLNACVRLINATHEGQDLFRPYSTEFLEDILDEGFWGEAPRWSPHESIYGWSDHYVLEIGGRILACAGLWDRGRNQRTRWRRAGHTRSVTVSDTSVLDYGYASGEEHAMEALLLHLMSITGKLGRDQLVVSMDQLPALAEVIAPYQGQEETRLLRYSHPSLKLNRPYTDLRFW